jgi:NIMA (never in mitosis gene a)-related kinase
MNVSKISEEGLCMTQTGTPYYASPEVWKDQPYDEKSDIWSLGCVLYELICLKVPFKAEDMEGLYKKVTRGIYSRIPPEYSQELSAVIRALLQVNPEQRPSCEKILKMPVVMKHMVGEGEEEVKCELLRTIKAETFQTISENLPKPNYQPVPPKKKPKGLKAIFESI